MIFYVELIQYAHPSKDSKTIIEAQIRKVEEFKRDSYHK